MTEHSAKHRIFSVPEKRDSVEVCGDKFEVRELSAYERGQLIEMRDNPTLAQAYIVCCAVDGLDPDTDTDEVYSSVAGHVVQQIADKVLELSGLGDDDEKND